MHVTSFWKENTSCTDATTSAKWSAGADWWFSIGQGLRCRNKDHILLRYVAAVTQARQVATAAFGHGERRRATLSYTTVSTPLTGTWKCAIVSITVIENNHCKNSFCFTTTNLKEKPSCQRATCSYGIIGLSFFCPLETVATTITAFVGAHCVKWLCTCIFFPC